MGPVKIFNGITTGNCVKRHHHHRVWHFLLTVTYVAYAITVTKASSVKV